jgi:hypothetical protein
LTRLGEYDKDLDAKSLHQNPLIVWGAAAMEGFFTDEEMSEVAEFLAQNYGPLSERPDVVKIIGQVDSIANLLAQYTPSAPVERLVRLGASCGLAFQARNMKGEVVADGLKMLG